MNEKNHRPRLRDILYQFSRTLNTRTHTRAQSISH